MIQTKEDALRILHEYKSGVRKPPGPPSYGQWAEANFWIPPDSTGDRPHLIQLQPHQPLIVEYALDPANEFQTFVFSTIKKSGKTTIAGSVGRYIAETWGPYSEVYCLANDLEQARGRVYQSAVRSIELDPRHNAIKREIPGYWRVIQREATHIPSNSILRAVSSDYKGEAGSNPTATIWSELWGYTLEKELRLWDELTPVPTRRSIRMVETYAGFEDEPGPLWDLWQLAKEGRQLTHDDIDWPFPGPVPLWVNDRAHTFAYIDQGPLARRMPWQVDIYYESQAATLTPNAFARLHNNYWTTSVTQFVPIEWWNKCYDPMFVPLQPGSRKPCVLGVDAAVSSDCCAVSLTSRNEQHPDEIDFHFGMVWAPPVGGTIDYDQTLDPAIRQICKDYNVVEIAYDAYQLHYLMTRLYHDEVAWARPFSQAGDRGKADKQLYDLIRDRKIHHSNSDTSMVDHLKNAAAKQMKDEDSKLRLIKKAASSKIDEVVATSMSAYECLRLDL